MATAKEPSEWGRAVGGIFVTVLSAGLIGLFVFVLNIVRENAVQTERINRLEKNNDKFVSAIERNTQAYNDLRVAIKALEKGGK